MDTKTLRILLTILGVFTACVVIVIVAIVWSESAARDLEERLATEASQRESAQRESEVKAEREAKRELQAALPKAEPHNPVALAEPENSLSREEATSLFYDLRDTDFIEHPDVRWGLAPSPITWSTLTVVADDEQAVYEMLLREFVSRKCLLTEKLLEPVAELAREHSKQVVGKDRERAEVEAIAEHYVIAIEGGKDAGSPRYFLRLSFEISTPTLKEVGFGKIHSGLLDKTMSGKADRTDSARLQILEQIRERNYESSFMTKGSWNEEEFDVSWQFDDQGYWLIAEAQLPQNIREEDRAAAFFKAINEDVPLIPGLLETISNATKSGEHREVIDAFDVDSRANGASFEIYISVN